MQFPTAVTIWRSFTKRRAVAVGVVALALAACSFLIRCLNPSRVVFRSWLFRAFGLSS